MASFIRNCATTLSVVAVFSFLPGPSRAESVRVTGDRVCLRASAMPDAEVVAQLPINSMVEAPLGVSGEWTKVVPPRDSVSFWVSSQYVRDGKVTANIVNVRSGAGLNFSKVGTLSRGDAVEVRGKLGDWTKIAPPPDCFLWVSSAYLEQKAPAAAPQPAQPLPAVAGQPRQAEPMKDGVLYQIRDGVPVAADIPADPEPAQPRPAQAYPGGAAQGAPARDPQQLSSEPASRKRPASNYTGGRRNPHVAPRANAGSPRYLKADKLRTDVKQGARQTVDGRVARAGAMLAASKYRLVAAQQSSGYSSTICHVAGDPDEIQKYVGKRVRITGQVYWLKSSPGVPAIEVESIALIP